MRERAHRRRRGLAVGARGSRRVRVRTELNKQPEIRRRLRKTKCREKAKGLAAGRRQKALEGVNRTSTRRRSEGD